MEIGIMSCHVTVEVCSYSLVYGFGLGIGQPSQRCFLYKRFKRFSFCLS